MNTQTAKYRGDIDGLRALAILSVIGFHAFPEAAPGGFFGVDVFFVISGYLITGIIVDGLASGRFRFGDFYVRRIRRLFPALIVVVAACFIFAWIVLFDHEFERLGKHIAAGMGFVANLVLWREVNYFDTKAAAKPLLHLWSLGIEEQFYIVWPALLLAFHKNRALLILLTTGMLAGSLLFAIAIKSHPAAVFYLPIARFWELMAGSALAVMERDSKYPGLPYQWRDAASCAGLALILSALILHPLGAPYSAAAATIPTTGAVLLLAAGKDSFANRVALSAKPFVLCGLISYPLYLWHWPLLSYAHILEADTPNLTIRLVAVAFSFALAVLTYFLFERPLRFGGYPRAKAAGLLASALLVGVVGAVTWATGGFPSRPANDLSDKLAWPQATRVSDGSCEKLLGLSTIPDEVCLTRSATPEILIIGDSHAMAFNSAAYAGPSPMRTLLVGAHGCLPFLIEFSDGSPCGELAQKMVDAARQVKSIRTVAIVNYDAYLAPIPDSGWTPRFDADAVVQNYSALIHELQKTGREVVFVLDVPMLPLAPVACIAQRPITLTRHDPSSCDQPAATAYEDQRDYRAVVERIRAANPLLRIYDATAALCSGGLCRGTASGEPLYIDRHHVSVLGSSRILHDFNAWLLRGAPDQRADLMQ